MNYNLIVRFALFAVIFSVYVAEAAPPGSSTFRKIITALSDYNSNNPTQSRRHQEHVLAKHVEPLKSRALLCLNVFFDPDTPATPEIERWIQGCEKHLITALGNELHSLNPVGKAIYIWLDVIHDYINESNDAHVALITNPFPRDIVSLNNALKATFERAAMSRHEEVTLEAMRRAYLVGEGLCIHLRRAPFKQLIVAFQSILRLATRASNPDLEAFPYFTKLVDGDDEKRNHVYKTFVSLNTLCSKLQTKGYKSPTMPSQEFLPSSHTIVANEYEHWKMYMQTTIQWIFTKNYNEKCTWDDVYKFKYMYIQYAQFRQETQLLFQNAVVAASDWFIDGCLRHYIKHISSRREPLIDADGKFLVNSLLLAEDIESYLQTTMAYEGIRIFDKLDTRDPHGITRIDEIFFNGVGVGFSKEHNVGRVFGYFEGTSACKPYVDKDIYKNLDHIYEFIDFMDSIADIDQLRFKIKNFLTSYYYAFRVCQLNLNYAIRDVFN